MRCLIGSLVECLIDLLLSGLWMSGRVVNGWVACFDLIVWILIRLIERSIEWLVYKLVISVNLRLFYHLYVIIVLQCWYISLFTFHCVHANMFLHMNIYLWMCISEDIVFKYKCFNMHILHICIYLHYYYGIFLYFWRSGYWVYCS